MAGSRVILNMKILCVSVAVKSCMSLEILSVKMSLVLVCVQDVLQAAGQYRENKASMYRAAENTAAEPEYIPWTGVVSRTSFNYKE